MNRAEALQTLRLDGSADGRTVESAYWNLVRQAQQRAAKDREARAEIDLLNEAYGTLAPGARRYEASRGELRDAGTGFAWLDAFADWVSAEALRTRARWPQRNPEIALIGGAAVVLMVLAIGAGASVGVTFFAMGLLCLGIWAPWRRA
jgi:hypothetical protein